MLEFQDRTYNIVKSYTLFSCVFYLTSETFTMGFQGGTVVKSQPTKAGDETQETGVWSLGWKDPLEEETTPRSVFLRGKSRGQRTLALYGPLGPKEVDMTEHIFYIYDAFFFLTLSSIICTSQRIHFVLDTILIYLYYYFIAWDFPLSYKIPLPPFLLAGFFQNTLPWFETPAWCLWVGGWVGEV